jgi:hypothetical protein
MAPVPTQTLKREGDVLPEVRTARTRHTCDDCGHPIEPGDQYELSVSPPHSVSEYDVDHWLTWRSHYPREGLVFLFGCVLTMAYREKLIREQLEDGHGRVTH